MTIENKYMMIWNASSTVPGFVEPHVYAEADRPGPDIEDQITGPLREFVLAVPGTWLYKIFVDPSTFETGDRDVDLDIANSHYDWETGDVVPVYYPERTWDDIRQARNNMLAGSDNFFNEDTPEPLKTEWVEHRQLLRDLITREQAAGRTPRTVKWTDYVPPYPPSARIGVPDDIKPTCAWYKGDDTFPPQAIAGSPESLAAHEEFLKIIATKKY